MSRRERERRPARRPSFLLPKPLILVVCEGECSEPEYLEGFKRWIRNPRVEVQSIGKGGVPRTLVQRALDERSVREARARKEGDENLRYDAVWCAFDVDDHPGVEEAVRQAIDNGLECAVSNACFELWLLLHLGDAPGLQGRKDLRKRLKAFIPSYDKHVDFNRFSAGYVEAVRRAERLERDAVAMGEAGRNPSTGFHRLTESIRGDASVPP